MIDLHLHLDGSLTVQEVLFLADLQNITLPVREVNVVRGLITAPLHCESLNDYLQCFELTLLVLQSAEALCYAVKSLIGRLAQSGIRYVEIRFAPQLHTKKGLSQKAAVAAAVKGLKTALQENPSIQAGLILCFMRGTSLDELNSGTLDVAGEFYHHGVCAVDLAGAEALYPTDQYRSLFAEVCVGGIPFTIHAGEAAGPESIRAALSFGAKRIGHGVRCTEDDSLVRSLAENRVTLELCPTSNLQTKAVAGIHAFPIRQLLMAGVAATVNTDNMTVSETDLDKEFRLLQTGLGLTAREKDQLLSNAINAAFLPDQKKQVLRKELFPNS